jgi:formate dehydrogenase maturation protein FdhE
MIINNKEFFSSPYYFYLKEGNNKYSLYFSVEETLTEARKKDEVVHFKKDKEKDVKKYLSKVLKSKEKKTTKKVKNELEELVNADGGMMNARTPMLNQPLYPRKTMDQTVYSARITNDHITRG